MRRRFIWGNMTNENKKLYLLCWDEICRPKTEEGLRLISLKTWNISLIAKWWGSLYFERNKVWDKLLVQRYGQEINYDLNDDIELTRASHINNNVVHLK